MLIRNIEYVLDEEGMPIEATIVNTLREHADSLQRLNMLDDYYNGEQPILNRVVSDIDAPNNKLVINYAEYISDFATAYFMGNDIDYIGSYGEDSVDDLEQELKRQHIHIVDTDNARALSKFGSSLELVYMSTDEVPVPKSVSIKPTNAYIVVDDSVEQKTLIGVRRYSHIDENNGTAGEIVEVYTARHILTYRYRDDKLKLIAEPIEHEFDAVPMIEYKNNSNATSDYESVLTLIDAYNTLMSDRVNDKEKFVQSLLVVYGVLGGDTSDEKVTTVRRLKQLGLLEMPEGTNAEYLTKSLAESDTEILRNALKNDIHKISKVPDMTDENFAANSSGVAMKYKLLGLEQLTKTKESYYKIGLRQRLELYETIYNKKGSAWDVSQAEIHMTRSLPVNELEIAQMVLQLKDTVSQETLLAQIPFVQDVQSEIEKVIEEKDTSQQRYQSSFGSYDFQQIQPTQLPSEEKQEDTA